MFSRLFSRPEAAGGMTAWRFVVWFGIIALLGDIVYEGARSITGPLLASLGASAAVVGVVTGLGEAAALGLRLVSGPMTDRTGHFWGWVTAGYALTVVSVPLLGLASALWLACALVVLERVGKAVRSPAKDTLLSHATALTGRGKGFAVHEALDQIGALVGPLTVAAILALTSDSYALAMTALAAPGVALLAMVVWLQIRVPDPAGYEASTGSSGPPAVEGSPRPEPSEIVAPARLPRVFWSYAGFVGLTMIGFATFGVLSFHLVTRGLLAPAVVPLLYAAVMLVDAVAALVSGWGYDRVGPKVLMAVPVVAAAVPVLAFADTVALAIAGSMAWGVVLGVQESTMRATVADLIGPQRRATAYGLFGAVVGTAAAIGGALAGVLYGVSVPALIAVTGAVQGAALVVLVGTLRMRARA